MRIRVPPNVAVDGRDRSSVHPVSLSRPSARKRWRFDAGHPLHSKPVPRQGSIAAQRLSTDPPTDRDRELAGVTESAAKRRMLVERRSAISSHRSAVRASNQEVPRDSDLDPLRWGARRRSRPTHQPRGEDAVASSSSANSPSIRLTPSWPMLWRTCSPTPSAAPGSAPGGAATICSSADGSVVWSPLAAVPLAQVGRAQTAISPTPSRDR